MKKIFTPIIIASFFLFFLAILTSEATAAQNYEWTKTAGGTLYDNANSNTVDASGNVYITGDFRGTVDFDPGALVDNHTSGGLQDIFLTRINADGTYEWTKTMGGGSADRALGVAVDTSGNIYLTGSFETPPGGNADFDPGPGTDNKVSGGGRDLFITKINAGGTYGWTKTVGGVNLESGNGIATDPSGNIYVTGEFGGIVDFNPDPGIRDEVVGNTENSDIFLTKINADGTYGWTYSMGADSADRGNAVTTDAAGNIFLAGEFGIGAVNFNPTQNGQDVRSNSGFSDGFLTKINSNATYGWTKTFAGAGLETALSVAADAAGNIFATGFFTGLVDFDSGAPVDNHSSNIGSLDFFLTKINSNGTYGWTKTAGGTGADNAQSVATDTAGNIYLTGRFQGNVDFDAGAGTDNHVSAGDNDIYITRINSDATYGWTKTMGGALFDSGTSVAADSSGNLFLTGAFNSTVDFDPGAAVTNLTSFGSADTFLVKFCNTCSFPTSNTGGPYIVNEGAQIQLDGTTSTAGAAGGAITAYEWDLDANGTFETPGAIAAFDASLIDGPTVFTVTLRVTDNAGLTNTASTTVTVNNVAPQASTGGPYNAFCLVPISLSAVATDPAPADMHTYVWDLDNDGIYETAGQNVQAVYPFDGVYDLSVQATDDDGGTVIAFTTVTTTCTAATADPGGPYIVNEGAQVQLDGTASTAGGAGGAITTYEWDLDGNGTFETPGAIAAFDASLIDGPAVFTVTLRVTDNAELIATASTTVTVNNVAPQASAGGPYNANDGSPLTLLGSGTDPAPADTLACSWDINGNNPARSDGIFELAGCSPRVSFATGGVKTIWLQVTDDDGGVSSPIQTQVTVTAPNACGPPHWITPVASNVQMHLTGSLVIEGRQGESCDEVAVFDSGGQLVGSDRMSRASLYGVMAVNGDSPATANIDEGAAEGGQLTVRVWNSLTQSEVQGGTVRLLTSSATLPGYLPYQPPLSFISNRFTQMDIEVVNLVSVPITAGWNLFGWSGSGGFNQGAPLPPSGYATGSTLTQSLMDSALNASGIASGSYVAVIGPAGRIHIEGSPFNNLSSLRPGWAYWIFLNADATLTLPGPALQAGETLSLPGAGWYQAAYWGADGLDPASAFRCINGSYDVIADGNGRVHIPGSPFNSLTTVNRFDGYFLHMTGAATLTYGCP